MSFSRSTTWKWQPAFSNTACGARTPAFSIGLLLRGRLPAGRFIDLDGDRSELAWAGAPWSRRSGRDHDGDDAADARGLRLRRAPPARRCRLRAVDRRAA